MCLAGLRLIFFSLLDISRWQKCVGVASSDDKGFGMAAGHAYIKEKFDDESRQVVSKTFFKKE